MSLNKHTAVRRLFIMQRHTSPIASGTRPHKMSYSSTTVPEEEEQSSLFIQQLPKLTEKQRETREKFLEAEKVWDAKIDWDSLTKEEIAIVKVHKEAVTNGYFTYEDPKLRRKVMTRLRHFLRGTCCGNACRHVCLYDAMKNFSVLYKNTFLFCFSAYTSMSMSKKTSKVSRFSTLLFGRNLRHHRTAVRRER